MPGARGVGPAHTSPPEQSRAERDRERERKREGPTGQEMVLETDFLMSAAALEDSRS